MGVGTCWPWETAATLQSAQRREALRRPRGRRVVGAYRSGPPQLVNPLNSLDLIKWISWDIP